MWLYVPLTGHITIWHILGENKSMRSEPRDIGLAFDVLTPKLPCLTSFRNLIFETNVVERVNSSQISLVVTCTTGCTCHHEVTLHRNQWNKSERKRLNTNWKVCVSSDQYGCADYWVLRKGCQASWSGGRRHSPPRVCSIPVGKRTLIHTLQIALCEPKSQTIRNMRRSSY